ncbi:MAG: TIGR02678 family protein [Acidimicrobiaceae bacterium]|nr:TIGR02678 family protein [Acidimicrobiaceae bacterium]
MSQSDAPDRLAAERRDAARFVVMHPLAAAERHPAEFALIRRHQQRLGQWFTQRFGYRLQVTADTARLYKTTTVPLRRPLRTAGTQPRPFRLPEYRAMALILAAVVSGPSVVSLRDLVGAVRAAAAEAGVEFGQESPDRRAVVTALRWMIAHGLATELAERVDAFREDEDADALLEMRPDRIAMLPMPTLARSQCVDELFDRSESRRSARAWMRALLLEEPVLYRSDLDDAEWTELRRRLGEETDFFDEMFGLRLEARAEGVMAVDPDGQLTDAGFPLTGTIGHAALLLADALAQHPASPVSREAVTRMVSEFSAEHRQYWSQLGRDAERLAAEALELLADHRLVEFDDHSVVVLPAAARYRVEASHKQASML